jgi:hypothetical protein
MGQGRLSREQRAAVLEVARKNPQATQAEIAQAAGVGRSTGEQDRGRRSAPASGNQI